jgi:hypothetical protein
MGGYSLKWAECGTWGATGRPLWPAGGGGGVVTLGSAGPGARFELGTMAVINLKRELKAISNP